MRGTVLVGLALWGTEAHALPRVQEVESAPIGVVDLPLRFAHLHELRLANCTGWPVLHLIDTSTGREVAKSDPADPEAPLAINGREGLLAVVRAEREGDDGACDLVLDDIPLAEVTFGWSAVAVEPDAFGDPNEHVTALQPEGATDTVLLGFRDRSLGQVIAFDRNGGTGAASRLADGIAVGAVFVGSRSPESAGRTLLYTNDATNDADGDGLGGLLELELGTCDDDLGWTPTYACADVIDPADTDRDGLDDGIEVLGLDGSFPQELPRWGASPLAKDVFVEIDRSDALVRSAPLDPSEYATIQAAFLEGEPASIRNPDGSAGVRVHFDVWGPTDPSGTLYGDWGGSSLVPDALSYQDASEDPAHFHPIRRGVFRYAKAELGAGGQASGWRFRFGGEWSREGSFIHELGHTLGLAHEGDGRHPGLNCSPAYPSIMNYAFGDRPYRQTGRWFSRGEITSVLDPAHIDEDAPANGFSAYDWESRWGLVGYGGGVDWDRSGDFERFDGGVRAAATLAGGCDTLIQNERVLLREETDPEERGWRFAAHTPRLVRAGGELWAFALADDGVLVRWRATHTGLSQGGCLDDALGRTCHAWGAPERLEKLGRARAFDVEALDAYGPSVAIAWIDEVGRVRLAETRGLPGGQWTSWEELEAPEWEVRDAVELAVVGLDELRQPVLGLFGTSEGEVAWARGVYGSGRWTVPEPVKVRYQHSGEDVVREAAWPPAVVRWPPQGAAVEPGDVRACAVLTIGTSSKLHCLEPEGDVWLDTDNWWAVELSGPPRLAFHVPRLADGRPAHGDTAGQFWITGSLPTDDGDRPEVFISAMVRTDPAVEAVVPPFTSRVAGQWSYTLAATGVELYEDLAIGGLKGLWLRDHGDRPGEDRTGVILYDLPLADGAVDVELRDYDDFATIEAHLCRTLLAASWTSAAVDARCGVL